MTLTKNLSSATSHYDSITLRIKMLALDKVRSKVMLSQWSMNNMMKSSSQTQLSSFTICSRERRNLNLKKAKWNPRSPKKVRKLKKRYSTRVFMNKISWLREGISFRFTLMRIQKLIYRNISFLQLRVKVMIQISSCLIKLSAS